MTSSPSAPLERVSRKYRPRRGVRKRYRSEPLVAALAVAVPSAASSDDVDVS
jgi:hypothetical protein